MMTKWKRDSSTYLGTNFPTTYLELFFESTSLSNEEVASNRERERERWELFYLLFQLQMKEKPLAR